MSSVTALSGAVTGTPSSTTYLRGDATWATVSGGGGTPGGSNTQVQYNSSGSFAGSANLTFDGTTFTVLQANGTYGSVIKSTSTGTASRPYLTYKDTTGADLGYFGFVTSSNFSVWNTQNTDMTFLTNGTEVMRLNTTGALVLAGGTTTANGVGIAFPATQSASTNANTLDDYEEGTWTPALTSAAGTLATVANGTGYYTKIGRLVTITCRPQITLNGTGSSALYLAGLPFASSPADNINGAGREDGATGLCFCFSANGSNGLYIQKYDATYLGGNGYSYAICLTYQTT
jgi:hypothetical protein